MDGQKPKTEKKQAAPAAQDAGKPVATRKGKKEKAPHVEAIFAVIRVRGVRGVRWRTRAVIERLRLTRRNHCMLIKNTDSAKGMLKLGKDYLTWGEASAETIAALEKKGKAPYALHPPIGGMEPIKKGYPVGALGYRGSAINELIKKMI